MLFFIAASSKISEKAHHRLGAAFATLLTERELLLYLNESRSFAALGRFWSGYAHELRHATAPALIEAKKLASWLHKEAGPLDKVPAASLRQEVKHFAETIENLERTVRYELGRVRRQSQDCTRVKESVGKSIRMARSLARSETMRLGLHEEPMIWWSQAPLKEIELALNPQVLQQPLMNLLDNALYHVMPLSGDGLIEVRILEKLDDVDQLALWIEVQDNGWGINADQQMRLFRPRTSTRGQTGVGMGLYISERLVQAAGGRLEFVEEESFRFLGATFRIRLPLRLAAQGEE